MSSSNVCIVIPARLGSTRLPRKMLLKETGKTLIEHTYQRATEARLASRVIVATDHEEIATAVHEFGGEAVMTSVDHRSGADRVGEVAALLSEFDVFVNVQGDEPEIEPETIDTAINELLSHEDASISTAAAPIIDPAAISDPNIVKVVCDASGRALYFSRSTIPYVRDRSIEDTGFTHLQHLGLYAYRREFLLQLPTLPESPLEKAEKLEQLRMLSASETIRVAIVNSATPGIDTKVDYDAFVSRYRISTNI